MQQITPALTRSYRDHILALMWLFALVVCICFCAYQITYKKPFHSNLLQLLPKDERKPILHELSLLLAERFQDKLLILVKSESPEQGLQQAQYLQDKLMALSGLQKDNPIHYLQQELMRFYRPYSQHLLSAERRQWLLENTPEQLAEDVYRDLFSPVALPRPYGFAEDPFNLGGHWLASLAPRLRLQEYHGFPLVKDEQEGSSWMMVSAQLAKSPFDIAIQNDVDSVLQEFYQSWPSAELLTSGMIFHANAGTKQATQEINTVGLGSVLGIVFLVLLVFRRVSSLIAVFLTMTSAYVLALTVSLLVFGKIHIITLVFGSTLLGVAGDYVLHFLMASQREGNGLAARHHLRYAMAIGAVTGIGAYLLQFTTPFPGLQQMAIFCSSGILGAWLTVLCLAPYYPVTAMSARTPLLTAEKFFTVGQYIYSQLWVKAIWVYLLLGMLVIFALAVISRNGTNDAVVNLNTSPKSLLAAEKKLQEILQQPSVNRFFFIEAASVEQILMRTQALDNKLAESGLDMSWQSFHQYVPSQLQQEADRQLVTEKLYNTGGAWEILCQKLSMPCTPPERPSILLTADALNSNKLAAFVPPLMHMNGTWYSLITLTGTVADEKLAELTLPIEGITLVNQADDLSQLLGRYRVSVSKVLMITIVLLTIGLAIRYGRRSWRMVLPLMMAMLFALGCAAVNGITLFHVMALLLVIGIGLDTAVFYTEGGFNADSWLASSLACCTSILAFGLLSLSVVPVLHQFGLIILVGILSCWLITPIFFRPISSCHNDKAS